MGWQDIQDKLLQTSIKVFGESCVFKPKSGGEFPSRCVFDNNYKSIDPGTGMAIITEQPNATIRLADLPQRPKRDDGFEVRGTVYKIRELNPDGQGGAVLVLYE